MNSEIWLRAQYQAVVKERDTLQAQLELKQKENDELRKSVFELSYLMSLQSSSGAVFRIGERLNKNSLSGPSYGVNHTPGVSSNPRISHTPSSVDHQFAEFENLPLGMTYRHDSLLRGHSGAVYCAAFSPSGRWLASGSIDRTVRIWDGAQPYKQQHCLAEHTQLVSDVCWERGSKENRLLSVSYDRTIRLWDTERGSCMHVTKLKAFGSLVRVFPSPNSTMRGLAVVACTTPDLSVVDLRASSSTCTWKHPCVVTALLCLPGNPTTGCGINTGFSSGDSVLVGDEHGQLGVYDLRMVERGMVWMHSVVHSDLRVAITDLVLSNMGVGSTGQPGVLLATQCSDNCLRVFDISTWDNSYPLPTSSTTTGLNPVGDPSGLPPHAYAATSVISDADRKAAEGSATKAVSAGELSAQTVLEPPESPGTLSPLISVGGDTHGPSTATVSLGSPNTSPSISLVQSLRGHSTGAWKIKCSFSNGFRKFGSSFASSVSWPQSRNVSERLMAPPPVGQQGFTRTMIISSDSTSADTVTSDAPFPAKSANGMIAPLPNHSSIVLGRDSSSRSNETFANLLDDDPDGLAEDKIVFSYDRPSSNTPDIDLNSVSLAEFAAAAAPQPSGDQLTIDTGQGGSSDTRRRQRSRSRSKTGSQDFGAASPSPSLESVPPGSLLLATGSTTGQVVLYDMSQLRVHKEEGDTDTSIIDTSASSHCWQRLDGHSGKAFGAIFSPSEQSNILVTFGGDGLLKVWAPHRRRASSSLELS